MFSCLFCNHEKSVTVKLEKKVGHGALECKVCGQRYTTSINCKNPFPLSAHSNTTDIFKIYRKGDKTNS